MGMAIAPKATGAVLATSAVMADRMGGRPRATSIAPVMATGAPKPASASSRAPKQNAMSMACTRMSPRPTALKVARTSSIRPLMTVSS